MMTQSCGWNLLRLQHSRSNKFAEKVNSVRQSTSSTLVPRVPAADAKQELRDGEPVVLDRGRGEDDQRGTANKSCQLDTAPTWLAKQFNARLLTIIIIVA